MQPSKIAQAFIEVLRPVAQYQQGESSSNITDSQRSTTHSLITSITTPLEQNLQNGT